MKPAQALLYYFCLLSLLGLTWWASHLLRSHPVALAFVCFFLGWSMQSVVAFTQPGDK